MEKQASLGKSFTWLNITQFAGALNDNVFKMFILLYLIGPESPGSSDTANEVYSIGQIVFVIPFLLFTSYAGKLADRLSKRNVIVAAKLAELMIMVLGVMIFYFDLRYAAYAILFVMAAQSAFFGPSKYGIIPELVEKNQLSRANGFIEGLTYMAVVIGLAIAPMLTKISNESYAMITLFCVALSVAGLICSLYIRKTTPAGGGQKASIFFLRDIYRTVNDMRSNRPLFLSVLASAYFLFYGGFMMINLNTFGMDVLHYDKTHSAMLFVLAAVGIGAGSFLAGKLSGKHVELGIVPIGALGLAVSSFVLAFVTAEPIVFTMIFIMGLSGGMFIVPLHSYVQLVSPDKTRGQVLAASSFIGWVGVAVSAGLLYLMGTVMNMSSQTIFIILGCLTVVLVVIAVRLLPVFITRLLTVMLTHLLYRIKITGLDNIPKTGGVLLVSNHVSWVDAVIIAATHSENITFIMDRGIYSNRWMNWFYKLIGIIPISTTDNPKEIIKSLRDARAVLDEGRTVCIFAEGAITRNGTMRAFRGGFERIMKNSTHAVVPVYLGGAWGSIFSYYYGKIFSRLPRQFPYPISVYFGKAMPAESTATQIRQKVLELSCDYFNELNTTKRSLGHNFVTSARKNWSKHCISDSTGVKMTYGRTLTAAVAMKDKLKEFTQGQDNVAIALPPSAGGVLANLAITMMGKTTVNLNYVASEAARKVAIEECGIKSVITSKKILEKVPGLDSLPGLIYIEDIKQQISKSAKLKAFFKARFASKKKLTNLKTASGNSTATIIYSSGSSGKPKGVILSHHNILANIEAVRIIVHVKPNDYLSGVLPFFHSFGYTCALWLPLIVGAAADYIANPLEGAVVGQRVRENKLTVLFAPPTFLLGYVRRAAAEDFKSLRLVAAGAEKLKPRLADSFEKKFGIRPLEGYGATELSPVVSLNVVDVEIGGALQIGHKPGTVGHPLPGVAIKILDVDTGQPLPPEEQGRIMIKSPSLMQGYLNMPEATEEAIINGWYNSGDIGKLDEDGFLTITDRLSRFSKIGGEMVPHNAIEEIFLNALNAHDQIVAITSVPDDKKGEELIVMYTEVAGDPEKLQEVIAAADIPNMWKPKRTNYFKTESMPLLGSGKLDILALRKKALEEKGC